MTTTELEARLVEAAALNQEIASTTQLPPELQQPGMNFEIQGINFQRVEDDGQNLTLAIPPIPALLVIPGNIGYLHQFFEVKIFTENAAPTGSGGRSPVRGPQCPGPERGGACVRSRRDTPGAPRRRDGQEGHEGPVGRTGGPATGGGGHAPPRTAGTPRA